MLLGGCGTTINDLPLNAPPHMMTARSPESVEIFMTQRPSRPFTEVAMLEAQRASAYSGDGPEAVMAKLREAAAQKGCDGIIMNGANDATVGSTTVNNGVGSGYVTTLKGYRATCIVYTTSAPVAEQNSAITP
jgi:hypothetical protein